MTKSSNVSWNKQQQAKRGVVQGSLETDNIGDVEQSMEIIESDYESPRKIKKTILRKENSELSN